MRVRRRFPVGQEIDEVAGIAQQLAVLLAAGVSPVSAWSYLLPADQQLRTTEVRGVTVGAVRDSRARGARGTKGAAAEPAGARVVRAAALAGPRGDSVADGIAVEARQIGGHAGNAWLALAAAWAVATGAGAPLADCLRRIASSFREFGQLQRDLEVALAGPAATARMVMVLPVAGILLGGLMGFDTLHTLFATVPGLLCLTAAALLLLCGARWNRRLLRRAETQDAAPGIALELIAIGMAGGGSVDRAVALARSSGERFGLPGESTGRIDRVIALSTRAGVPAAELLRSEADQARRDARSDGQRKAATLAVTLMLPLGLCVLPAFMLVGVVPLLLAVLSSTFAVL